mmetsp:Transcript_3488/g.7525  ORF Transcript_3488/g.7525 Transcript_3488/m.7525 type:complete len:100 (-) Transcript_3488:282-581(-)
MRELEAAEAWSCERNISSGSRPQSIYILAHSVKGAALQLFAKRLASASATLESSSKAGKSEKALAALLVWYEVTEELIQCYNSVPSFERLFDEPMLSGS